MRIEDVERAVALKLVIEQYTREIGHIQNAVSLSISGGDGKGNGFNYYGVPTEQMEIVKVIMKADRERLLKAAVDELEGL